MIVAYQTNPSERELESCLTLSSTVKIRGVHETRKDFRMASDSKTIINSNAELFLYHANTV